MRVLEDGPGHEGGDVDHLAAPRFLHLGPRPAGEEKEAFKVKVEHLVPVLLPDLVEGHADVRPRVVHEDVEPPQVSGGLGDHFFYPAGVGDVRLDEEALAPHVLDFPFRLPGLGEVDVGDGDVRSHRGEADGEGPADPPARSRDEGGPPREVKVG